MTNIILLKVNLLLYIIYFITSQASSHFYYRYRYWNKPRKYITYKEPDQRGPRQIPTPLSMELCKKPLYQDLRTCKMAWHRGRNDVMKSTLNEYFCKYKDEWFGDDQPPHHTRGRRAVNECGGNEVRQVLLEAYEADRPGVVRELVHDPENHLYQTLFVKKCQRRGPIRGFHCRMQQIKFKAAVWALDPNSNEIEVMDVLVDGYCALTQ